MACLRRIAPNERVYDARARRQKTKARGAFSSGVLSLLCCTALTPSGPPADAAAMVRAVQCRCRASLLRAALTFAFPRPWLLFPLTFFEQDLTAYFQGILDRCVCVCACVCLCVCVRVCTCVCVRWTRAVVSLPLCCKGPFSSFFAASSSSAILQRTPRKTWRCLLRCPQARAQAQAALWPCAAALPAFLAPSHWLRSRSGTAFPGCRRQSSQTARASRSSKVRRAEASAGKVKLEQQNDRGWGDEA